MKRWILRYLPHVNQQTLMVIYVVLILAAMVMSGGAPTAAYGTGG